MSDVGACVLAEWRVVPENVVSLSVFVFGCRGEFVVEGELISAFVKCFLVPVGGGGALCQMNLCPMKGMKVVC